MKNSYTIAQRNALVEEHLYCIANVMRSHRGMIRAAHLDPDDVYQQLALRLIKAVGNFDPQKGDLETHIHAQLRHELQRCASAYRRFGITDAPRGMEDKVISFEDYRDRAAEREMALVA